MKTLLNDHEINILSDWAYGSKMPEYSNIDWILSTACREYLEILKKESIDVELLQDMLASLKEHIQSFEKDGYKVNSVDILECIIRWVEEHKS